MLAGLVAETAAGRPYREVMRRRVFKPLGMTRTVFLPSEVLADNDFAYGVRGPTVFAPDDYDSAIARPAGYVWTSVEDLAKFSLFLLRGNRAVLSPRMWRLLQSPKVNTHQFLDRQSYAYGLGVWNGVFLPDSSGQIQFYDGVKMVGHDGGLPGYRSLMLTLPHQGFGYAATVNGDAPVPATDLFPCFRVAAVEAVGDRLPAPSPPPDPQIQRDRFADYVGTFHDTAGIGGRYVLTLRPDGELGIELPDFPDFQINPVLLPTSRDNFLLRTEAGVIPITGFREEGSAVVHLRTRPFVWTRRQESENALRTTAAPANVDEFRKAVSEAAREQDASMLWATPSAGGRIDR
jgi:CubicO group peptidase (beta-lactamase class C family)